MDIAESFEELDEFWHDDDEMEQLQQRLEALLAQGPEITQVSRDLAMQLSTIAFAAGRKYQSVQDEITYPVNLTGQSLAYVVGRLQEG